ncbi:MAG: PTS sugar transporter subunit IIA [Bacteroidota bacterium]
MPTTLSSLLAPSRIRVGLRAGDKSGLLAELVALASTSSVVLDTDELLAAVEAREAQLSTGVGKGLAFPHARTSAVSETLAAFATLATPIDFDALDGEPVRLVMLIAGTDADRREHVRLLSRISRVLSDEATRRRLLAAKSPDDVLEIVAEAEAELV